MLRLIVFLVLAIAGALAATWLADQPGGVVLAWGTQEIRTSLAVAVAALVAFAALVVVAFELLRWLRGVPRRWWRRRGQNRERRGFAALANGMIAAAAGDAARARHLAREARQLLPSEPGVLLLTAQAAQLEGKEESARQQFRAMLKRPETELLGLRGLLAGAAKVGDQEEALELARRAYRRSPDTPWVASTLFDLLIRDERWEEAQPLLGGLVRQNILSEEAARRRRAIIGHMSAVQARQRDDLPAAQRLVRKATKLLPGFAPSAVLASEIAAQRGQARQARRVLEIAWGHEPHPELARAYAQLVPGETPTQRLERFQKLERLRPGHPETCIVLGELAIAAKRIELARNLLGRAVEMRPTQRACRLMAELERAAGAPSAEVQRWLARAAEAKPDKGWVADDSGNVVAAWAPFGPGGGFDTIHWAEPPQLVTLLGDERSTFVLLEAESSRNLPAERPPAEMVPVARPPREAAAAAG